MKFKVGDSVVLIGAESQGVRKVIDLSQHSGHWVMVDRPLGGLNYFPRVAADEGVRADPDQA